MNLTFWHFKQNSFKKRRFLEDLSLQFIRLALCGFFYCSCPPTDILSEVLSENDRTTFFEFLTNMFKCAKLNHHIGTLSVVVSSNSSWFLSHLDCLTHHELAFVLGLFWLWSYYEVSCLCFYLIKNEFITVIAISGGILNNWPFCLSVCCYNFAYLTQTLKYSSLVGKLPPKSEILTMTAQELNL